MSASKPVAKRASSSVKYSPIADRASGDRGSTRSNSTVAARSNRSTVSSATPSSMCWRAEDRAEQGHLGEAGDRDRLPADWERHASGVSDHIEGRDGHGGSDAALDSGTQKRATGLHPAHLGRADGPGDGVWDRGSGHDGCSFRSAAPDALLTMSTNGPTEIDIDRRRSLEPTTSIVASITSSLRPPDHQRHRAPPERGCRHAHLRLRDPPLAGPSAADCSIGVACFTHVAAAANVIPILRRRIRRATRTR